MSAAAAIAEVIVAGLTEAGRLVLAEKESNVRLAIAAMHGALPDLAADYRSAVARREAELRSDADELSQATDPDLGDGEG